MKLLVDSNVILDLFDSNRPHVEESIKIIDFCQLGLLEGYFATFSVPSMLYILRKTYRDIESQHAVVDSIIRTLQPASLEPEDLTYPFEHQFTDYEDGLQAAAAARCKADYIITHNLKDFAPSPIPPITPEDFVKNIIVSPK